MNTNILTITGAIVFALFINAVYAQGTYQFGGMPSVNVNSKFKNDWSFNAKIESRQLFQRGDFEGNVDKNYENLLTDFSLIAAKKVGLNSRLGGGYLLRAEGDEVYHRFIVQYIVVQRLSGFRLAHRFLGDYTISESELPEFRARYRISSEIPLNGEAVDPGEFYLKINNEYLNAFQASDYDLEIRLVPLVGYDLTDNFKIETGLDYRVKSFINSNPRHSYWINLNFFIEI